MFHCKTFITKALDVIQEEILIKRLLSLVIGVLWWNESLFWPIKHIRKQIICMRRKPLLDVAFVMTTSLGLFTMWSCDLSFCVNKREITLSLILIAWDLSCCHCMIWLSLLLFDFFFNFCCTHVHFWGHRVLQQCPYVV